MSVPLGEKYDDVSKLVDNLIAFIGKDIRIGMPLALGKPIRIINELYKRAKQDPSIKLKIITALALERPTAKSEIERRLLEPLVKRVFKGFPDFEYMLDFRAGKIPPNVELFEFFNKAGGYLGNTVAQQNHMNSNYTHAIRDAITFGVNVYAQMLAKKEINGKNLYSMSCNPDISTECIGSLHEMLEKGEKVAIIAEVNENLPFMYGDAVIEGDQYSMILENSDCNYPLFGPPKESVSTADHMIGLHVSTLLKDGGTIQVGIGALGDAIVNALRMREKNNKTFLKALNESGILERYSGLIKAIGGLEKFDRGLYGSSEMFVDAFMELYNSGILKRKVYESIPVMELINEEKIDPEELNSDIIDLLLEKKAIHKKIKEKEFNFLSELGILKDGLRYNNGLILNGEEEYSADMNLHSNREAIKKITGKKLNGGNVILGAFFIGPKSFYETLRNMPEEERKLFGMAGVERVNQLYGGEKLRALQRKDARFINTGMIASIFGSIASDALSNGQVISGIGGQYNFVSMAHALPDARLIMMIRSTKGSGKKLASNIVFNYGHCSVPKHLRDIIVTEYGIADIRGKIDKDVIAEMIQVTDSRFQNELVEKAKKAGKLPNDWEIPPEYRNNYPEKLENFIENYKKEGHFQVFPFGTDIMDDEVAIGGSLRAFKTFAEDNKIGLVKGLISEFFKPVQENAIPFLKRMDLLETSSFKEKILQKIVLLALRRNNKI